MTGPDDLTDVHIRIPLGMVNRHGLVAGATGTGKTKTLQLLAEQLSANGVPVFAADIKGDLSGLSTPGRGPATRSPARAAERRPAVDGHRLPGRVLRPRRPGHRHPAAGHHERLRPDAALQGARPQRDPGVLAWAWSSTTPTGPACRCSTSPTSAPSCSTSPATRASPTSRSSAASRSATAGRHPARADLASRTRAPRRSSASRSSTPASSCAPRRRQGPDLPGRAAQPAGPPGGLLDVPDVAARRPLPRPARGRRHRQAQAGLLLRRGAPALPRRLRRVPRPDRPDRAADPVQGGRRLLRDAEPDRRARRGARPARLPRPAPAPRPHAQRRQGAQGDREHLPQLRVRRPRRGDHRARHRRGRGDRDERAGRPDPGGLDPAAGTRVADGPGRRRPR